ncbi:MAG: thioesterase family protein [Aureispira sp.]
MRIKLDMPQNYDFRTELTVRVTDINYGGHVGNEMLLVYAQQARTEWFRQWGYGELDVLGMAIIMTDAAIIYQAEMHEADVIEIEVGIKDRSRLGFDLYYQMTNKITGKQVARVKTGILCFDYDKKKVAPIPTGFVEQLELLSHE